MAGGGSGALASLAIGLSVLFAVFLAALAAEIYYMLCCASASASPSPSPSPLKRLKLLTAAHRRRRINSVQVVDAAHKVAILDGTAGWPLQSPAFFGGSKSAFFNSSSSAAASSSPLRYDHYHHHDHFLLATQPYGFLFTIAEETKEEMELQSSGQLVVNINVVGGGPAGPGGGADPSLPGPPLSSSVPSCRVPPPDLASPPLPPHDCTLSAPSSAAQIILARRSFDGVPLISGSPRSSADTGILPNSCSRSDQTNIHCYSPDSAWSANYIPPATAIAADSARSLSDRISKASPSRDSGGSPPSSSNSSDTPFLTPLSSPADATAHHTLVRSRSIQCSALSSSNSGRFHVEMPSETWSHFSPGVDSSYMYDDHGTLGTLFRRPYTSPSRYSPLRPTAWSGRITDFRKWKVFHNSLSLS